MTITEETIAETVTDRLSEATVRLTEVAGSAGDVVREADRTLRGSSDQVLGLVGALSVGMAIGLVFSGSSRLLVAAALVPAAMVAGAFIERMDRAPRARARA